MLRHPNDTSEINYTKWTFNFPNDLRLVLESLIREFHVRHLSEVVEIILRQYIEARKNGLHVKPKTLRQLSEIYNDDVQRNVFSRRECVDPPRRYHGWEFPFRRNSFYSIWWKKIFQKNIDTRNSNQYYIDWDK